MHNAHTSWQDEADFGEPEPEVLTYLQFRNHLGLLEWRRRRAAYLQDPACARALRQPHAGAPASGN